MTAFHVNRPLVDRPEGPAILAADHPMARKLAYAILDPLSGVDSVSTAGLTTRTGTRRQGRAPMGSCVGFGSTFGAGATDRWVTPFVGQSAQRTWAFWLLRNGLGAFSSGRLLSLVDAVGIEQILSESGGGFLFARGHSTTAGNWTFPFTNGVVSLLSLSYDSSSVANNPEVYVSGLRITETETQTPVGTARTSTLPFKFGNSDAGDREFDGLLGPVICWDRMLSAGEHWSLFDPQTRWDLWRRPSTRVYLDLGRVAW
jgi:hypothetical protein